MATQLKVKIVIVRFKRLDRPPRLKEYPPILILKA